MSLQFVLGNSGSGKTTQTYKAVVEEATLHPKKNYILLVPEQFTLQTQRRLVDLAPNHVITNIDVLSFKRLAYRVFEDMGCNNYSVLEETGKNLVLRKVALEKKDELSVMQPNMSRIGYIEELKSLISELMQYGVSPDKLEQLCGAETISPVFSAKIKDVATMYRGFCEHLKSDEYITAEEILSELIRMVDHAEILKDSVVVLDDFTGFTPLQNQLLYKLMPIAERMQVILTIGEEELAKWQGDWSQMSHSGEHELFHMTKKTISTLCAMASEQGIMIDAPILYMDAESKRFSKAPDLAHLEKNLLRVKGQVYRGIPENIHVSSQLSPKEELIWVAREITSLVREHNYRYGEIAVVTGAVDTYEHYAKRVFAKYAIPCFMDQTTQVLFHPFIECVRALLEIVQDNFSYQAVMRFVRSGYTNLTTTQIDALDNFLIATGIRGKNAWDKNWIRKTRQGFDMEQLEASRCELMDLLSPLYEAFCGKQPHTVSGEVLAIYEVLGKLKVAYKLQQQALEYKQEGNHTGYYENSTIYQNVMELLEKIYFLFEKQEMSVDEFTEILDAGLSAAKVAVLPPAYDSVTVGDIERTRLDHVKVLFFIGVNDGVVPKKAGNGGIISEYEREMLQEAELELAPGAREQAFIQRFYLYRNLTKPSQKLYISYARADKEGKAIRPSYLIETVCRLFPDMEKSIEEAILEEPSYATESAALDYLLYGRRDESWYALAKCLLASEEYKDLMQSILAAPYTSYNPDLISEVVAEAIYGRTLHTSVSRLENYAACAYKHFLTYGLHLKEREKSSLDDRNIGNLYHDALKKYSLRLKESSYDWFGVPDEVREQLAEDSIKDALLETENAYIYESAQTRHMTERMQEIFKQTVWALTTQVRAGKFSPEEFEISFSKLDNIESLQIELGQDRHVKLTGQIDRMDICREDGKTYVKIIDYKSGSTSFDLLKVYRGQMLQLTMYLNVAMEHCKHKYEGSEVEPAAMLYYHIDDPVLTVQEALSDEEYKEHLLRELRPEGLINVDKDIYRTLDVDFEGDSLVMPVGEKKDGELKATSLTHMASTQEFEVISQYVSDTIAKDAREIFEGNVAVNPYEEGDRSSCKYCPYTGVCGIDLRIPGFGYRHFPKLKKEEVIGLMQTDNARNSAKGEQ